jgi:arylsulfatase A-like enzyme
MRLLRLILLMGMTVCAASAAVKPNIILILADDLGFSDIGCYGGEIKTPNIDALAKGGIRFSQFYNGARCCPTRASLMTGLYAHQAGVGDMVDTYAAAVRERMNSPAYTDRLSPSAPTVAEELRKVGYRTLMSGKWHLGYRTNEWPSARGFDRSFALIHGAMNYYGLGIQNAGAPGAVMMELDGKKFVPPQEGFFATDAFTDYAIGFLNEDEARKRPFFLYMAYNAPHWPLQARAETIAKHRGTYRAKGWDKVRAERLERLKKAEFMDERTELAPRAPRVAEWEQATEEAREQWDLEMAVYAAQVEELDTNIGRLLEALKKSGRDRNTMILFMSDNGGAAEDPNRSAAGAVLGTRESYEGYRVQGAHVSSAPFRKTKKFTHEGGIAAPLIVNWEGIDAARRGSVVKDVAHIIDMMPTVVELAGGAARKEFEGVNLAAVFKGETLKREGALFWEHEGNRAAREGNWKIVSTFGEPWELYDLGEDRTELRNLARSKPEVLARMAGAYEAWAKRVGVLPWQ